MQTTICCLGIQRRYSDCCTVRKLVSNLKIHQFDSNALEICVDLLLIENSVTFCKWKCPSWLILISNRAEKKIQGHFLYAKCYLSSAKTRLRTLGLQSHSKVNVNYHYFGLKPVLDGFPGVTNKLKSWLAWNQPNFESNVVFWYVLYPERIGAIIWTASRLSNLRNCKDSVVLLENTH